MDKRYGILIVSVTILVLCFVAAASATTWTVNCSGEADFTGIQDAINTASAGDTIIVYSGVYYENVVVYKSVTLIGNGQPVVDASGRRSAITLTADGITLVGFKATNSGSLWKNAGISVASNNNTITGNNASNNNDYGIRLTNSSNNTITGNNASNNNDYGILLEVSRNKGVFVIGNSRNNTIAGNNVRNNPNGGIRIRHSPNNIITHNNVSNSGKGIYLEGSNNNTITGNNVCNNRKGIDIVLSHYNNIYLNNLINNMGNVVLLNPRSIYSANVTDNIWNSPLEITHIYGGTTYESYLGNYWDDYVGTDADCDGIGDTPYNCGDIFTMPSPSLNQSESSLYGIPIMLVNSGSDDYPLMMPFDNYVLTTSAPA